MNLKCTPRRTDRHYLCIVPSSGPHQLTHGPAMHLLDEECRWILLDASTRIAHTNQQHNTNESEDWAHRTVARARSQESRAFAAKSKAARTCWVTANEQKSIFFLFKWDVAAVCRDRSSRSGACGHANEWRWLEWQKKKKNLCGACVVLLLWPRGVEQAGKIACHTKTHRVADSPAIQPIVCRVHVTNYNNIVR